MLAEVERIASGREDGVDRHLADRAMVRMVHPLVVDEQDGGVVRHDHLRPERSNRVRDPLPQAQRRLDLPVRLVEELDAVDADLGGGRSLLALPQLREGRDIGGRVVAALVAARREQVANGRSLADPARNRAGGAELDVIGMRRDDKDALGGGQLIVRHRTAVMLAVRPARRSACPLEQTQNLGRCPTLRRSPAQNAKGSRDDTARQA